MKKLSLLFICAILFGFTSCKEEYPDLDEGIYAEVSSVIECNFTFVIIGIFVPIFPLSP